MSDENRFFLRILSPTHIGCDEVFEPLGFVVDELNETLAAFEPLDFFRTLSTEEKKRFSEIAASGTIASLLLLNKFMKGQKFPGHTVSTCKGFIDHYRENLALTQNDRRLQQELNRFTIARSAFNMHDNRPYIPGSAIKGALRTAYLNALQSEKNLGPPYRDAKRLEADLLGGSFENDPLRFLKVSDFMPVNVRSKIIYAVNVKKKPSNRPARGPYQILEVIEPGSIFTGTLKVDERGALEAKLSRPATESEVLKHSAEFFNKELRRENEELQEARLPASNFGDLREGCPLRIGRHSGAESVTIAGHRNIRIMQGRGTSDVYSHTGATTVWLVAQSREYDRELLRPFGWAMLGHWRSDAVAEYQKRLPQEQEKKSVSTSFKQEPNSGTKQVETVEETWHNAYVSFNAGGGGIITANLNGRKAELRGKEKCVSVTDEPLQKKLFEGKKNIPKADVAVRKLGNNYEIIAVKAPKC
jgi:CRISPR-associated protein Csm5